MATDFDLESLVHIEQTFYDAGYEDGFAHGRIHGLIEGRALGREKGFEMWEELGYYEGFGLTWKTIHDSLSQDNESRAVHHIQHLLELISQFPRANPSTADTATDLDIPKLFRQIRSRYKALCATLGVRASLRASATDSGQGPQESVALDQALEAQKRNPVWTIESEHHDKNAGMDLSF